MKYSLSCSTDSAIQDSKNRSSFRMTEFTHFNERGEAHMVDVGQKQATARRAIADGCILMNPETLQAIIDGKHKKGDVLGIARIAGIMAAKRTSELVPLCHPLSLTHVSIDLNCDVDYSKVYCSATVETHDKTGVEMEALTAVQTALLTVYDMCKSTDRGMVIQSVQLLEKSGGRSGHWRRENA